MTQRRKSMNHRISFVHLAGFALLVAVAATVSSSAAEPAAAPALQFPKIEKYGSVAPLPTAEERPRAGGCVVFDRIAHSAMIFNRNRQTDGWATIGVY